VFTARLVAFDPLTGPLPVHPSLLAEAVGACAAAARRRLGVLGAVSPWRLPLPADFDIGVGGGFDLTRQG
jgi:hypothetical protein